MVLFPGFNPQSLDSRDKGKDWREKVRNGKIGGEEKRGICPRGKHATFFFLFPTCRSHRPVPQ